MTSVFVTATSGSVAARLSARNRHGTVRGRPLSSSPREAGSHPTLGGGSGAGAAVPESDVSGRARFEPAASGWAAAGRAPCRSASAGRGGRRGSQPSEHLIEILVAAAGEADEDELLLELGRPRQGVGGLERRDDPLRL